MKHRPRHCHLAQLQGLQKRTIGNIRTVSRLAQRSCSLVSPLHFDSADESVSAADFGQLGGKWQGKTTGGKTGGAPRRHASRRDATSSPPGVELGDLSRLILASLVGKSVNRRRLP